MKPPEEALRSLVAEWVAKAEKDFQTAARLVGEGAYFQEIVGFHSQQAAEKYLKALLVRRQVEFPRTHDIGKLLDLVATIDSSTAEFLRDADILTPFGVKIRYPGDAPEMLASEEAAAVELARRVKDSVMALLGPYLSGR